MCLPATRLDALAVDQLRDLGLPHTLATVESAAETTAESVLCWGTSTRRDTGQPIVYSPVSTRQRGNKQQTVKTVSLVIPVAARTNQSAGARAPMPSLTTLAHLANQCAKSNRERVPLCVSLGNGILAGDASSMGSAEQHVHAAMLIRIKAHMEPTSTTAYGSGDLQSSTAYPSHGDCLQPARVVSVCFTSVSSDKALFRAVVYVVTYCARLREVGECNSEHVFRCRDPSISRHELLVWYQSTIVRAGAASYVLLHMLSYSPALRCSARNSSAGGHPTSKELELSPGALSCIAKSGSCAQRRSPTLVLRSPGRQ